MYELGVSQFECKGRKKYGIRNTKCIFFKNSNKALQFPDLQILKIVRLRL